jgi:ribosomal-protein-alanine N-acetyltransferase
MSDLINIKGNKVILKTFIEDNLTSEYVDWLNDSDVVRFSEQRHRKHTLESNRDYFNSMNKSPHYFIAILDIKSGKHIGNITCYNDVNNSVSDIAILIGEKDFWKGGYGTDAFTTISDYLLNDKKVRKLTAGTMSCNTAMIKLMEKSGFSIEGRREKHFILEGREYDLVYGAKFKSLK